MLNYSDRVAIIESQTMQQRIVAAVTKYALYVLDPNTSGITDAQLAWAKDSMRTLSIAGKAISYYLLSDPNFLGTESGNTIGSDISDANLQGAVEVIINARFVGQ